MKREEKEVIIDSIADHINEYGHFYLTDISDMNAATTSDLRRQCFKRDIKLVVVKNTLLKKAFEKIGGNYSELDSVLNGHTAVMFTKINNSPAKLIQEFRRKSPKPILKGAYVEESVYLGDDQVDALVNIKSKEELIADVIYMLQSPIRQVISALQSGSNTITGVLKTLEERAE